MFRLEHPEAEAVARIIWQAAQANWLFCIGGDDYPRKRQEYDLAKSPQPGDLVIEQSGGMRLFDCAAAVGWLLREDHEALEVEEWDQSIDGPIPLERVAYIKTVDGREFRWTNYTLIRVPTYLGWWDSEWGAKNDPLKLEA